jgi:hypothetical protein
MRRNNYRESYAGIDGRELGGCPPEPNWIVEPYSFSILTSQNEMVIENNLNLNHHNEGSSRVLHKENETLLKKREYAACCDGLFQKSNAIKNQNRLRIELNEENENINQNNSFLSCEGQTIKAKCCEPLNYCLKNNQNDYLEIDPEYNPFEQRTNNKIKVLEDKLSVSPRPKQKSDPHCLETPIAVKEEDSFDISTPMSHSLMFKDKSSNLLLSERSAHFKKNLFCGEKPDDFQLEDPECPLKAKEIEVLNKIKNEEDSLKVQYRNFTNCSTLDDLKDIYQKLEVHYKSILKLKAPNFITINFLLGTIKEKLSLNSYQEVCRFLEYFLFEFNSESIDKGFHSSILIKLLVPKTH